MAGDRADRPGGQEVAQGASIPGFQRNPLVPGRVQVGGEGPGSDERGGDGVNLHTRTFQAKSSASTIPARSSRVDDQQVRAAELRWPESAER
jgi:hypothetical protein